VAIWTEAQALALTTSYIDELDLLAGAVGEAIRDAFLAMPAYERAQLAEWLERITPVAKAGAAEGADLAGAYLAELTGTTPPGVLSLDAVLPALEAPFHRMWHNLGQGMDWEQARHGGASQAQANGEDSVGAGATKRMGHTGTKVIAHQRVPSSNACDWCQVVATQMYRTAESASLNGQHHNCRCRVIAVTEENAKALRALNRSRLRGLKKSGAVRKATEARARSRD
jgi:hypothetical protein